MTADPIDHVADDTGLARETSILGRELRRLRTNRGLSLQELARRADVSVGLLSQIERGISSPSLRTLTKLRSALDVSLGQLFDAPAPTGAAEARFVRRLSDRAHMDFGPSRLVKELLSPDPAAGLQMMVLLIPPDGGSGDQPYHYGGEKAGLVLEGFLRLTINGHVLDLRTGDSFQFDSQLPHSFRNLHRQPAKVLWIINRTGAGPAL